MILLQHHGTKHKDKKSSSARVQSPDDTTVVNTEMATASLATGRPSQAQDDHAPESNFEEFVRTALHGIKGQMDEFRGQINTITEDLVKKSDFNTNEIKDLEAKQQVQQSLITELRRELSKAVTTIKTEATQKTLCWTRMPWKPTCVGQI